MATHPASATASPSPQELAFGDLERELDATRRVLERVPDDHLSWKPHPKSMSLGSLALHVANLLYWQITTLRDDEFDFATSPMPLEEPESREEILQRFDENRATLSSAIAEIDEEALGRTWTLRNGEQTLMAEPKFAVLRIWGISHVVHHRGQLSVYLRLLDIPVPSVYGPTADEQPEF